MCETRAESCHAKRRGLCGCNLAIPKHLLCLCWPVKGQGFSHTGSSPNIFVGTWRMGCPGTHIPISQQRRTIDRQTDRRTGYFKATRMVLLSLINIKCKHSLCFFSELCCQNQDTSLEDVLCSETRARPFLEYECNFFASCGAFHTQTNICVATANVIILLRFLPERKFLLFQHPKTIQISRTR